MTSSALTHDTICALATPVSTGADSAHRALVRISGNNLSNVYDAMLPACPRTRGLHTIPLVLQDNLPTPLSIPVLAAVMPAPKSYTGEDVIELLVPAGSAVTRMILDRILSLDGVRHAEPGEFTARAYLHDKLSLTQAEGVAAMIGARTHEELARAHQLLQGDVGARYEQWSLTLARLLALVEAGIDFTDQEDVIAITPNDLHEGITTLAREIEHTIGEHSTKEAAHDEPLVLIVGRPNAGKTTLFNALIGSVRSVVSGRAGTTRDVIVERITLSEHTLHPITVRLGDTAGITEHALEALDALDTLGQARARDAIKDASVVVHCDAAGEFPSLPVGELTTVIRVRTKSDLVPAQDAPYSDSGHSDPGLSVCAIEGASLDTLRAAIIDGATAVITPAGVPARHRANLAHALAYLNETASMIGPTISGLSGRSVVHSAGRLADLESLAWPMRAALDALGRITGRIDADDVLGRVFSTFCVGK